MKPILIFTEQVVIFHVVKQPHALF